jgi:hypothetical protein
MDIVVPEELPGHVIRTYGVEQGFRGLPVRHGTKLMHMGDKQYIGQVICTSWKPDADELARLNAGGTIDIELNTATVAPMLVTVSALREELPEVELPTLPGVDWHSV